MARSRNTLVNGRPSYLKIKKTYSIFIFLPESIKGSVYTYALMRQTKYILGLPLAIALGVMLATSASVGSVFAASNMTGGNMTKAGNMTAAGGAAGNATKAGNMTAAGGAAGNATKAGNMTAAGGAAGNATKAASNATSANSSNPLAKIGQALSGLFGGKK
ncbi:MAG: hypothetical protein ACHQWH_02410 [Nitrososphaerales archaeon]